MKKIPDNQIAFYQSPDGSVNIEVLYAEENIWLSQKKIAELFDTTTQNITQHLKNIYAEGEADQTATCKDFLQVQKEGERQVTTNNEHLKNIFENDELEENSVIRNFRITVTDDLDQKVG